jgi:inositol phosphorylceramide synthase catalytic subunit
MQEFNSFLAIQTNKPKLPFLWPASLNLSHLNPIPHKYRPSRRLRMRQKAKAAAGASDSITGLKTSFNVLDSIRALRRRKWRLYDLQHVVVFIYIIFSLCIIPPAPLIKLAVLAVLALLLLMPVTQQFFLPSLPIWTYLLYFFSSR